MRKKTTCPGLMRTAKPDCNDHGLLLEKFTDSGADFIFFTDEKVFSVASPVNLQNDRVCAA